MLKMRSKRLRIPGLLKSKLMKKMGLSAFRLKMTELEFPRQTCLKFSIHSLPRRKSAREPASAFPLVTASSRSMAEKLKLYHRKEKVQRLSYVFQNKSQ